MSLSQKIIAAIYSTTDKEDFGFYVAEEPALIEKIIEAAELPFNEESYIAVKSRLYGVTPALKGIGVDVVRNGDYWSVFGPGVLKNA